jgi:hypothetical protein
MEHKLANRDLERAKNLLEQLLPMPLAAQNAIASLQEIEHNRRDMCDHPR